MNHDNIVPNRHISEGVVDVYIYGFSGPTQCRLSDIIAGSYDKLSCSDEVYYLYVESFGDHGHYWLGVNSLEDYLDGFPLWEWTFLGCNACRKTSIEVKVLCSGLDHLSVDLLTIHSKEKIVTGNITIPITCGYNRCVDAEVESGDRRHINSVIFVRDGVSRDYFPSTIPRPRFYDDNLFSPLAENLGGNCKCIEKFSIPNE